MKNALITCLLAGFSAGISAQTFEEEKDVGCLVQVAFAVSEGDGQGEYSITRIVDLEPGEQVNFRGEQFVARRIYGRLDHDEMFIIRFEHTGITHFINATVPEGYEALLKGGCTPDQVLSYKRDGVFVLKATED